MRDRQEGFEKKFAMDEDSKFKAMARRNKLLGLWAAEKLGKTGPDADDYAKEVVRADFEEAGTMMCCARCARISTPLASHSPINRFASSWTNC